MTLADVSVPLLDQYLEKVWGETLDQVGLPLGTLLEKRVGVAPLEVPT